LATREERLGIFDAGDPLRLEPFKVRYLSRRCPAGPAGPVGDLPQRRWRLPDTAAGVPYGVRSGGSTIDPEEYVPLFVEAGWRRRL
jgi:hypothetical protein